jgi:tRNA A-37 threonylcarbamoyl transferase component Bud32
LGAEAELYDSDEAEDEIKILPPDTVVSERYRLMEVLGRGGMGVVYKAEQIHMKKFVAMKMMLQQATASQADHRRFQREAQAASLLSHPNIISIYDFGFYEGQAYLCMDYLQGKNLEDFIKGNPLTLDQFRHIFAQACDALQHAHDKGIVHRDLKPGNLCISERNGDPLHLFVLDFGLVKMMGGGNDGKLTTTNMVVGSPLYMSPEQCRALNLDHRSDIYSLACVMYESLCGIPPFRANTVFDMMNAHISQPPVPIRETAPGVYVPAGLDKAILQALAKNPDDRPQSMNEFAKAIEASFSGAPDVVMPSALRSKISNPMHQSMAGEELKTSGEMAARKKKNHSTNLIFMSVAIWIGVAGVLSLGIMFGLSLHKGGDKEALKPPGADAGAEQASSPAAVPSTNATAVVPNNNGNVISGNTIQLNPPALPAVPDKGLPGKLPAAILPPLDGANGKLASPPGALPLPALPGANQNATQQVPGAASSVLPPLPPTQIASIVSRGTSPGSTLSPEQIKTQGFNAYSAGNYQDAISKLASLSDAESNSAILGRLFVSAYQLGDSTRATAYLNMFKNRNRFSVSSEVRNDYLLLKEIFEASGQPSSRDDYEFAEAILKATIDASERRSEAHGLWYQAVLNLNRVYRDQGKNDDADRLLSDASSNMNSAESENIKRFKSPVASAGPGGPMPGGPMGGGPMGAGPNPGGPMGGGPMGGGPMGGGPMGRGPMGGGPVGGGPMGGPMGGRFAGPPGQDGGG